MDRDERRRHRPRVRRQPAADRRRSCPSGCRRSPTSPPSTAGRRCWPGWPSSGRRSPRSSAPASRPTFENTVVALERSGALLARAWNVFGNLTSSVSTPRLREIEREVAPLEAAHDDAIRLDPALFARIDAVHAARHDSRARRRGRPAGRALPPGLRAGRCAARRGRPAAAAPSSTRSCPTLSTTFGQNLQLATEAAAVRVADAAELDGLDRRGDRRRPPTAAADRGVEGYLLPLLLPTGQPVLAKLRNRGPAPPGVRGLARPGVRRGARQPSGRRADRPAAGRARPAARLRHPRRPGPRRLDRAHHRRGRRDARLDGPGRRWPTPRPRPRCSPRPRPATASSWPPGTGRSTASGSAPSATPSTPPRCGRTSSWTGCWSTASSTPPSCSTASASRRGPTWPATTPTSGCGRSATPTAPRSGSTSATSSPGRASAAARG